MSHEKWLITGLASIVLLILGLSAALVASLEWSILAIVTLLFIISYPLLWLSWRYYQFWCHSLMQLSTYTQILREGERNIRFKKQHPDNLLLALQRDIHILAVKSNNSATNRQHLDALLPQILDSWPNPVCIFDHNLNLTYRNAALIDKLKLPLLLGTSATELGFIADSTTLSHPVFAKNWQCQSFQYQDENSFHWFFSATDVANALQDKKVDTQKNLIRVLGHEIRNSLTPMSSLADTLLSQDTLPETQVRKVLERIRRRSDRLLAFIGEYSQLSRLPPPQYQWLELSTLVKETAEMLHLPDTQIEYSGPERACGDKDQLTHVLINLFKNARESFDNAPCQINVRLAFDDHNQIIEVIDNGPGFANLENVLTPFYTTKSTGSGIGLSLCAEIARNHHGELTVANNQSHGATITIVWPLIAS